ncbi:MAG: protein-disulfide reductase DsbD domain-containing protein, partial [Bradyrhizobium sp.]
MKSIGIALAVVTLAASSLFPAARATQSADVDALVRQSRAAKSGDDFLPPEQAFRFTATADGPSQLRLIWAIAPGYYLYRDRIQASAELANAKIGAPQFPAGQVKNDEYFGKQVVYHNELVVPLPVQRATDAALTVPLKVTYQGCAEAGLCYPPVTRQVLVELPPAASNGMIGHGPTHLTADGAAPSSAAAATPAAAAAYVSEQDRLAELLRSGSLLTVLLQFFIGGLLLAFTPCVLPMVPILSGLIVGQGASVNTSRAFLLSLTYVLGMAVTYT